MDTPRAPRPLDPVPFDRRPSTRGRTPLIALPDLALVVLCLVVLATCAFNASAAVPLALAQAPTPAATPTATAVRPRTPTIPPIRSSFAGLRDCPTTLIVRPSLPHAAGSTAASMVLDLQLQCPQLLTARTAVVVIGALGEAALPNVRATLKSLVDGFAGGGSGSVAFVDATAAPGAIVERSVDTARGAVDTAIANTASRPAGSAEDWQASISAAIAHLLTLPPTRMPMLVVIDGTAPTGNPAAAVDALSAGLRPLHDGLGLTLVLDLSTDSWLLDAARFGGGNPQSMLYSSDTSPDAKDTISRMAAAMAMLGGPITQSILTIDLPETLEVESGSVRPSPDTRDQLSWSDVHKGHQVTMHIEARLRAARDAPVGLHPLMLRLITRRDGLAPHAQFSSIAVCVHPADSTAACVPTPTPTPTASRTPVATDVRTATRPAPATQPAGTATDVPPHDATATALPTITATATDTDTGQVWLPVAMRWR